MDLEAQDDEWWTSFHVAEMADVLLSRSDEQLATTLEFLERELKLSAGDHVFDQCCGSGDLAIPLANRGIRVTGCDLFEPYIERARRATAQRSLDIEPRFFCADAFDFVPDEPVDAVINWYSSFGYAAADDVNQQMLDRAFEALKPAGLLALEVPNIAGLLRGFKDVLVQHGMSSDGPVTLERTCIPDFAAGLLRQRWEWQVEGREPKVRHSALKMYMPNRVCELLREAGFVDLELFGSDEGEPFEMDSPRLLVTATKPA